MSRRHCGIDPFTYLRTSLYVCMCRSSSPQRDLVGTLLSQSSPIDLTERDNLREYGRKTITESLFGVRIDITESDTNVSLRPNSVDGILI